MYRYRFIFVVYCIVLHLSVGALRYTVLYYVYVLILSRVFSGPLRSLTILIASHLACPYTTFPLCAWVVGVPLYRHAGKS